MGPSATSQTRGSVTLSPEQIVTLREMLEEQRDFRLDQLEELRNERGTRAGDTDGEIHDSLVAGARAALRDVLDALARMDAGRYGVCRECQQALPSARLEVLPQLALCMDCQRTLQA